MERFYVEEETFDHVDFLENPLTKGDYENCTFSFCNLSSADIADINFISCTFDGCNMSLTNVNSTAFRGVEFINCKIVGIHFDNCKELLFDVSFDRCTINLSSFYKMKIKNTVFQKSVLHEVDFAEADLTKSSFVTCDLAGSTFDQTILEKADFRTAFNYSIDPDSNKIKKAKFSRESIAGLLDKYDIEIE